MNTKTKLGVTAGILAAALLAACGGGGSSAMRTVPPNASGSPSQGSGTLAQGTSAKLTFTLKRAAPKATTAAANRTASSRRSTAAKRAPKYLSYGANGFQITVTSGAASQTIDFNAETNTPNLNCQAVETAVYTYACTVNIPVLGPTESIAVLSLDTQPDNLSSTTGLGTAFPSNSHVLGIGSQTVTLTPGVVNTLSLSVNPVIDAFVDADCGSPIFSNNMGVDTNAESGGARLVVTAGVASSTFANPAPLDATFDDISAVTCAGTGGNYTGCTGQSFVDVNGSPEPVTISSNSSAFAFYPLPIQQNPFYSSGTPPPVGSYTAPVSMPDSSYLYFEGCGMSLGISYSGAAIASGTTVTLANNLSATPPTFTGSPAPDVSPQPGPYTATMVYTVVPLTVSPATSVSAPLTITADNSPQSVTGNDPGILNSGTLEAAHVPANTTIRPSSSTTCISSSNVEIASITAGSYNSTTGNQTFSLDAQAVGTCSFVLFDQRTGTVSQTIFVSVTSVPT
jgi:hypothetical protein